MSGKTFFPKKKIYIQSKCPKLKMAVKIQDGHKKLWWLPLKKTLDRSRYRCSWQCCGCGSRDHILLVSVLVSTSCSLYIDSLWSWSCIGLGPMGFRRFAGLENGDLETRKKLVNRKKQAFSFYSYHFTVNVETKHLGKREMRHPST